MRDDHEVLRIGVSEFKRRCLELLEKMRRDGREVVLTKRGEPIARVVPVQTAARALRGSMKGLIAIKGDIVECDWSSDWEATR